MSDEIKSSEGSGDTTRFWNKVIKRRTARWIHGCIGAAISGGASTVTAQAGLAMGKSLGIPLDLMSVQQLVTVFMSSGLFGAFAYLKQSPLPSIERKYVEGDPTEIRHIDGTKLGG